MRVGAWVRLGLLLSATLLGATCVRPRAILPWYDAPHNLVRIKWIDYRRWWRDIERCSERRSNYRNVAWYVVADTGDSFELPWRSSRAYGAAWPERRAIVLAAPWLNDPRMVRHEILHLVASPDSHDPALFQRGACAALVYCWAGCREDTVPRVRVAFDSAAGARFVRR